MSLMILDKMGARYASRLSFARSMLRTMFKKKWNIVNKNFNLDKQGYGYAIYEINTKKQVYSLIC